MWALGLLTWGSLVASTDSQMAAQVGPITSFQHAGANSAVQHYDMNIATIFFDNHINCIKSWTFVGKTASEAISRQESLIPRLMGC